MYGKLFVSIYDGTLVEDWRALITFQQMIILCDSDGILDMTPFAIQKRTGIPIEHIKAGIEILEAEDPYSRTKTENGKRIIRLSDDRPWGWSIVNHKHYKELRTAEDRRAYMREYMRKKRAEKKLTSTNKSLPKLHVNSLADTDTDTDTDTDIKTLGQNKFDLFWKVYPKKVKKKDALRIWKTKKLDTAVEVITADVVSRGKNDRRWLNGFIPDPPTYLNGERWNDEIEPEEKEPPSVGHASFKQWEGHK